MPSITGLQAHLGRGGFTAVVVTVVVVILVVIAVMRSRGAVRGARLVALVSLTVGVAGVCSLTLFGPVPQHVAEPHLYVDPLAGARGWDGIAWRPVFDNVVLFVPVGALAAAAAPRRASATVWLASIALSIGIEAFQYLVPTGRVANAADVVANATGAGLGVLLASLSGARGGPGRYNGRGQVRSSARD